MTEVNAVNLRMFELLGVDESFFDGICIAIDVPDEGGDGSYRKPSPRFALEMIEKYGLDPALCWFLGDSECDVKTGINAGMRTAKIGRKSFEAQSDGFFDSVPGFVEKAFVD